MDGRRDLIILSQGNRFDMEDEVFFLEDIGGTGVALGGVFDGHGGIAARLCRENFPHFLLSYWQGQKLTTLQSLRAAFLAVDQLLRQPPLRYQDYIIGGAVAGVFALDRRFLSFAHVGDVRAFLVTTQAVVEFTRDHRPTNPKERQRVIKAGSTIIFEVHDGKDCPFVKDLVEDNELLFEMTRVLGDRLRPRGVISTPSLRRWKRTAEDRFFILATDGLWNYWPEAERREKLDAARRIEKLEDILALLPPFVAGDYGEDNIAILILDMRKIYP